MKTIAGLFTSLLLTTTVATAQLPASGTAASRISYTTDTQVDLFSGVEYSRLLLQPSSPLVDLMEVVLTLQDGRVRIAMAYVVPTPKNNITYPKQIQSWDRVAIALFTEPWSGR